MCVCVRVRGRCVRALTGDGRVARDAGSAERLHRAVTDALRHVGRRDLDHRDLGCRHLHQTVPELSCDSTRGAQSMKTASLSTILVPITLARRVWDPLSECLAVRSAHKSNAPTDLVADGVHHVRRLECEQPGLFDLDSRHSDVLLDARLRRDRLSERDPVRRLGKQTHTLLSEFLVWINISPVLFLARWINPPPPPPRPPRRGGHGS